jgi:uncharacterized protein (TIGR02597 family)
MKFLRILFLAALPLVAFATPSDPVGVLRLKLRGNSDTIVSLPLHRASILEAKITIRSGNQLTLASLVPSLPPGGAYVLVMSGALEGAVLPIASSTGNSIIVDPATYDLSVIAPEADVVALIPFWTLDSAFPGGQGVHVSTDILNIRSQILTFSETTAGTNLAASASYFYFAGDGSFAAGWYRFGDFSATRGTTRLNPHRYFIVRHPAGTLDTELLLAGNVQMSGARAVLGTRAANRAQDNHFSFAAPVPITLGDTHLVASGAFTPSTDILAIKDKLLVFNNSATGRNKSASATYFYFTGDGVFAAGWYRFGDMSQTTENVALKPGEGLIIRKSATVTAETHTWSLIPSYLQ